MKVSRAQAAENRASILASASRLFRAKGFDGAGITELMQAAGLTNGAFYGHFASKDDLMAQVCAAVPPPGPWSLLAEGSGVGLDGFITAYLHPDHVRNRADGCLLAALAGDAARQIGPVRRRFTHTTAQLADLLCAVLPGAAARRRDRALSTLAALVGALTLARAVDDPALADQLLRATIASLRRRGSA
jgi:TetR/AcrR family transcriptional repressor of nem operon